MLLRELYEASSKTAVLAFGRMNPPTIGHKKLADKVASLPGDPYIFLSQSQKPKTDPLDFSTKVKFAQSFFPNVTVGDSSVKTIIQALQKLESMGYTDIVYVAGSDRIGDFTTLINKYNGTEYNFDSVNVVNAGERDPDADGAEGMSASKMRAAAASGNLEAFAQGVPDKKLAKTMFNAVRNGMGVRDSVPTESMSESLNALSQWKNDEPVGYVKHLTKFFGAPDELTYKRAVWYNKDGFKRVVVLDEYILHTSPSPHYDYVYSYVDMKVPHNLSDDLARSSESILVDHLKGEVGGRCASLTANAVTIQYVIDVVEGNVEPSKVEYENRIRSMHDMFDAGEQFELEWWPDSTDDASPENEYYTEAVAVEPDPKGYDKVKLTMPQNTLVIDTASDLDWYKIGKNIANLDQSNPHEYGQGDSDVVVTSASPEEMQKLMKQLDRLGLQYKAIGGTHSQPEIHATENFADGKKPGRKGLAKRSGVNTKASVSSLRKTAKNSSGEKQRMAHWQANMKAGRAKAKK
jgi:nicotinic acid mononucleotide adenylyltransferase